MQDPPSVYGVGHVVRERSLLDTRQRLFRAVEHAHGGDRLAVAELVEEIRAEQGARRLLEEQAGFPTVRDVRGVAEAEAAGAGAELLVLGQSACGSAGEVVDANQRTNSAADWLGPRR